MTAIEIIPKEKIKALPKENVLFYLSLGLVICSLLAFLGLDFYQRKSQKRLRELEETLAQEKTREEIRTEQRVFETKKRIEDFSALISDRKKASQLFEFLERSSHPKVLFSSLSLDMEKGQLMLGGETESFSSLGEQLLIFKGGEFVEETELSEINIGKEGSVRFSIDLLLRPELFK